MDGGVTHKFIEATLVERVKFSTKNFDQFVVIVPGNNSMDCNTWIPKLQLTIGNYTVTEIFYVVNVVDTNLVMGFQWLYSIGENIVNYQVSEMSFKYSEGNPILVRGMHTYPNQVVSSHSMRSILIHGDIE